MAIKKDTLDGLLAGRDPQTVFAKDGLFDELKKLRRSALRRAHQMGRAAARDDRERPSRI